MEDLTGKQLGPYQIIAPLGEGGMAAVYKGYHAAMERYVTWRSRFCRVTLPTTLSL
jgi:hypothetical protein